MATYEFYFYVTLLEFLGKRGYSPQLVERLLSAYQENNCTLCFPEHLMKEYTSAFFGSDEKFKQELRVKFTQAAFRDLASELDNPEVRKLFEKFQKISNTSGHLFVLILEPEREHPLHRGIWSNSPTLFESFLTANDGKQKIHVLRE